MRVLALMLWLLPLPALAEVTVVAVNGPLAAMARAIGGEEVTVFYPVPAGADPALWRPSIAEIAEIQAADVILLNGAGFAGWTTKTSLPRAKTVLTGQAFEDALIETPGAITHAHGAEGAHSHAGIAPQTWLDFAQAAAQAEAISTRLARITGDAAGVQARTEALMDVLTELDTRAQALGAAAKGRVLIADHPGLEYFARAYGLEMRTLDWPPGAELPERAAETLAAAIEGADTAVFLWQAAPGDAAATLVEATGLTATIFDPGTDNDEDFLEAMQGNLASLEAILLP